MVLHKLKFIVEVSIVVLLQVVLDGAEDAGEGVAVKPEEADLVTLHANGEGPLIVVDESELTEVFACAEGAHMHEPGLLAQLVELEAVDLAGLDDEEVVAVLALLEDELALEEAEGL